MQAQLRTTKTPGFQDFHSQDFPASLGKKTQNQPKSKVNPQHKILNNEKHTENLRDHGNSYQTGRLNSDMPIESLGSRDINPNAVADGCFSVEDLLRKHGKNGNPQQEVQRNKYRDDVNEDTAKERLGEFPLESLTLTKAGTFDGRSRETKEYLLLCQNADVDPRQYYNENINRQAQNHHEEEDEKEQHIHNAQYVQNVQNGGHQDARAKLRDFPLSSLKITKSNYFDMRKNISKEFVALCESAGVDPMEYYYEYCDKQDNNLEDEEEEHQQIQNVQSVQNQGNQDALAKLRDFPLSSLKMTKNNNFDMRKNISKEFVALCESAGVDPLEYYFEYLNGQDNNPEPDEEEEQQIQNVQNGGHQDARAKLRDFPLSSLKITKSNYFDMRKNISKEFVALCESAGVDPMEYYYEYCNGQDNNSESEEEESLVESIPNYQPPSYEKSNKIKEPVYQNHQHQREDYDEDKEAALAKLREFPLNELRLTKSNILDMRKNNTKDYLLLCSSAKVDPMDYYFENLENPSNNMNLSGSVRSRGSEVSQSDLTWSSENTSQSNLTLSLTKDNKLDRRFNSTKDFIKEKISEAELRLSQFDTSQLKKKSNGELDKRFKVNKEYLELQEQTQQSYWENMKFN